MSLTKDRFGGLLFLLLSITYGYYAADIPLLPGDKFEPFHAQTMPYWLLLHQYNNQGFNGLTGYGSKHFKGLKIYFGHNVHE